MPSLVLTMRRHDLIVPGEVIFDHLGSKDKSYASVEGAVHALQAGYGDTVNTPSTWLMAGAPRTAAFDALRQTWTYCPVKA